MKSNIYEITKLMLTEKDVFTYNNIAEKASISNKTIRNNILEISNVLESFGLTLIKSPGVGLKIIGDKTAKTECYKYCENKLSNNTHIPSKIRQAIITYLLLDSNNKITISYLEKKLFITRPSIYNDLKIIKQNLKKYGIDINKNRKNGIFITTGEKRTRHCLLDLSFELKKDSINNYFICDEIINFIKQINNSHSDTYIQIENFIKNICKVSNNYITYTELNRAATFMNIAFYRVKNNHYVKLNPKTINKIKNKKTAELIKLNIDDIIKKLNIKLINEEIIYIAAQLSAYMVSNYENLIRESSDPATIMNVINDFYHELSLKLKEIDYELFKKELFPFLEKTLQKSNFDYDCYNPHTPSIKKQYPQLFVLAKIINKSMNLHIGVTLPEDAIATITALLAYFEEQYTSKIKCCYISLEHPFKQKLTLATLKNNLPNINIEIINEFEKNNSNYDLLLCDLDNYNPDNKTIFIPSIINDDFLSMIKDSIRDIRDKKRSEYII